MSCPIDKPDTDCLTCGYSKELICDYPYKKGMSYEQCQEIRSEQPEI